MLLEAEGAFEIVGEASNGLEAIKLAKELKPDMVICDVSMPRLGGFDATAEIHQALPATRILLLSMHEGDEYFYKALKAGGSGYVLKRSTETELLTAVHEVLRGGIYLRQPTAQRILQTALDPEGPPEGPESLSVLTPREREVLQAIASGMTNQEIADRFVVSVRTIETHRAHIIDKLGIRKRSELVQYALRKGLVE